MKETEVEYETTEVLKDRVYCDTCGGDCTDDFQVEGREVCPSCHSETRFQTLERCKKRARELKGFEDDDERGFFIILTLLFPITLFVALETNERKAIRTLFVGFIGTLLYVTLPLVLILMA